DVRLDRRASPRRVHRQGTAEQRRRVQVAEHEIGIRHGRALAALSVAHRPRLGARALRPDPQRASRIDPRDAATTPAHPRAVADARSTTGTRIGCPVPWSQRRAWAPPPTSYSEVVVPWPRSTRLAFAVVPPMSKESTRSRSRRRPTIAAAITPAAGPDSTAMAGIRSPSSPVNTPPLEPGMYGAGSPMPVTAFSRRVKYEARIGPT